MSFVADYALAFLREPKLRRRFFGFFILLVLFGSVMAAYPSTAVCRLLEANRPAIESALDGLGGESSTRPAAPGIGHRGYDALRGLFCSTEKDVAPAAPTDRLARVRRAAPTVFYAAFVIAYLLTLALGRGPRSATAPAPDPEEIAAASDSYARLWRLAKPGLGPAHLRSRRLRVAVVYALLSGIATMLVPPAGEPTSFAAVAPHLIALATAAVAASFWGVGLGAWTPLDLRLHGTGPQATTLVDQKTLPQKFAVSDLAHHLGFAPAFLAGLMAVGISLPYQAAGVSPSGRLDRNGVLLVLAIRLVVLPVVAAAATAVGAGVMVKWFRWPRTRQ